MEGGTMREEGGLEGMTAPKGSASTAESKTPAQTDNPNPTEGNAPAGESHNATGTEKSTAPETGITIREGQATDCVRLAALTEKFFPYIRLNADQIFERIKNGVRYFVLEQDGALVGFIDFEIVEDPNERHETPEGRVLEPVKTAKILGLCISEPWQGKGWGKRLFEAALEEAKKECRQAVILVEEANKKAITIYEKHGFQKKGKLSRTLWGREVLLYVKKF